jgi:NAD(P)-dependent dehydrogenase (short-subunit alcohol dehydrogenase family)
MAIADVSDKSIAALASLEHRTAIVTGGAQGLGAAICNRLAEAGARVLICDINDELARATAQNLSARHGVDVRSIHLDVTKSASVEAAANSAIEQFGRIDIWVNNAGIFPTAPLVEMTEELWDRVTNVNSRGVFLGSREAARRMIAAEVGGVIVNIVSTAGFRGERPGFAAYVSSKHAVRGATRQMAIELAPHGIRVLGVAPSFCATEGVIAGIERDLSARNLAASDFVLPGSLLGRGGVPDDIARAVLFCVSDMSIFMTGSTLLLDAGELA